MYIYKSLVHHGSMDKYTEWYLIPLLTHLTHTDDVWAGETSYLFSLHVVTFHFGQLPGFPHVDFGVGLWRIVFDEDLLWLEFSAQMPRPENPVIDFCDILSLSVSGHLSGYPLVNFGAGHRRMGFDEDLH